MSHRETQKYGGSAGVCYQNKAATMHEDLLTKNKWPWKDGFQGQTGPIMLQRLLVQREAQTSHTTAFRVPMQVKGPVFSPNFFPQTQHDVSLSFHCIKNLFKKRVRRRKEESSRFVWTWKRQKLKYQIGSSLSDWTTFSYLFSEMDTHRKIFIYININIYMKNQWNKAICNGVVGCF